MQIRGVFVLASFGKSSRHDRKQPAKLADGSAEVLLVCIHDEPVELLVEERREEEVVLTEMPRVKREDRMAVGNSVRIDGNSVGEDPRRDVVLIKHLKQAITCGCRPIVTGDQVDVDCNRLLSCVLPAQQLLDRKPNIARDLAEQSRRDVTTSMERNRRATTVRVPVLPMRTPLPDLHEPKALQQPCDLAA